MTIRLSRRHLLALIPGSALVGCGFQPVYMPTATGKPGPAERELAAIDVGVIADRPGQLLRQALQQRLGNDAGERRKYDLKVAFWVSGEGIGIGPDNLASRVRLVGHANWTLSALDTARTPLANGSTRASDGVNVFTAQYFAQDMANEAATRRIATAVADQVALQLALHFRKQAEGSG